MQPQSNHLLLTCFPTTTVLNSYLRSLHSIHIARQAKHPNDCNFHFAAEVQEHLPTLSSLDLKKRTKKRPMAAQSLLESHEAMQGAHVDPVGSTATPGNGVPDFVKKLYRQVHILAA